MYMCGRIRPRRPSVPSAEGEANSPVVSTGLLSMSYPGAGSVVISRQATFPGKRAARSAEPYAGLLPPPALRPVAADHPVIPGGLGLAGIHPAKLNLHLLAGLGHRHDLGLLLRDQRVLGDEVLAQDLLEVVLVEPLVAAIP